MQIKFQASYFSDLSAMVATPELTMKIMGALAGKGVALLPNVVREISPQMSGPVNRPSFMSPDGESQMIVGSSRIDVIRQTPFLVDGESLQLESFLDFAEKCIASALFEADAPGSRLAFISNRFSGGLDDASLSSLYERVFRPTEFFKANPPCDWTFRTNSHLSIDFGVHKKESVNSILKLERSQGQFIDGAGGATEFDGIFSEIDINTFPANHASRFLPPDLVAFVKSVQSIVGALESEVNGLVGVEL